MIREGYGLNLAEAVAKVQRTPQVHQGYILPQTARLQEGRIIVGTPARG
jgi:hypothetical protein